MNKKVIALGNRIMMDDAIGIKVTEYLKDWILKRGFEIIIGETDIDYCLGNIEDNDYIIIIDAAFFHEEPGKVTAFPISKLESKPIKGYSQHEMNLLELLNIEGKKITGSFICIEIANIDFGYGLSDTLEKNFSTICELVKREINIILEVLDYA